MKATSTWTALSFTALSKLRGGDDTRGGDVEGDPELDLD